MNIFNNNNNLNKNDINIIMIFKFYRFNKLINYEILILNKFSIVLNFSIKKENLNKALMALLVLLVYLYLHI